MKHAISLAKAPIVMVAALLTAIPLAAPAAPVDLSDWTGEQGPYAPSFPDTKWTVQGPANDSVFQTDNFGTAVFFNPSANSQGNVLAGKVTVETSGDDDFIGFVLGYNTGEFASPSADFWMIDWKQTDEPFWGNIGTAGSAGMALSHVTGDVSSATQADFWNHTGVVNEVQRAGTLGRTGWVDFETYLFEIAFTPSLIELKVNGLTELSYSGRFSNGSFGFYTNSQSEVRYAGITVQAVPAPGTLPLVLAGIGALGLVGWRCRQREHA